MEEKIICSSGPLKKNQRRGTMKECAERNKIYYYGLVKADKKIVEEAKINKKKQLTVTKARIKVAGLRGRLRKINRQIEFIRSKPSEKKKDIKKDKKELELLEEEKKITETELENAEKDLKAITKLKEKEKKEKKEKKKKTGGCMCYNQKLDMSIQDIIKSIIKQYNLNKL